MLQAVYSSMTVLAIDLQLGELDLRVSKIL